MIIFMEDDAPLAEVGGKAASLKRLAALGFEVPPFLSLPTSEFGARGLRPTTKKDLVAVLSRLGPGPYAARSSAIEEDGDEHSYAGQFLSLLDLDADQVPGACAKVFNSGKRESVAEYRSTQGLNEEGGGTAVLVQQMVKARIAGVAFTADPMSGQRNRIIISAIEGLGDKLVAGEEDGQTYIVDKAGSLLDVPDEAEGGLLKPSDVTALVELANRVEKACGKPQDIEWAFEDDRLYLLQARPITTALAQPPIEDETLTVLDNSNIVESYPGLVSPLTYSFAQYVYARVYRAFVRLLGVNDQSIAQNAAIFDNMLAHVDGRAYYNLVNWYRALALLPGFSNNRDHMETMMGVDEPLPPEVSNSIGPPPARGFDKVAEWARMAKSGLRLIFEAIRLKRSKDLFYKRLNNVLCEPASGLNTLPLTALAAEYRRIEADLLDRWDAPLVNDFLCMIAFGASRKLLERWGGAAGLELHNDIMIGQGDIISAEPAKRIRTMGAMLEKHPNLRAELAEGNGDKLRDFPELAAEVASYLARFSDRCAEELKLESITLDRDPTPLYRAIAAGNAIDVPDVEATEDGLKQLLAGKPFKRLIARPVVSWAKARVRDRENLRYERTRIFGRARHLFRAMGTQFHAHGMIADADDIYFLTVQEILGAIEGFSVSSDLARLVAIRKAGQVAASARPDPDERILIRGAVTAGYDKLTPSNVPTVDDTSTERTATGCSAGTVTATARVIRDPRTESLKKGDILVARHTDPGWIAIFSNASAIVVERGSLLSHSAIVARELGIPCVVGLKGAVSWIKDGETVSVDGRSGHVRRLK